MAKKRVGNPLGESKLSKEEQAAWREAAHFSTLLKESADRMFDYFHGRASIGGPEAYSAVERGLRLLRAQEEAMARRSERRRNLT
jgi:hypothetical protein